MTWNCFILLPATRGGCISSIPAAPRFTPERGTQKQPRLYRLAAENQFRTQAGRWAAENYAQAPNDPPVVSTYAYALHLQGRDQAGLAAMQKLPTATLEEPSVALYYGVLLSATGKGNEAAPYLKIAQTQGRLLPEEKQLLATTRNELKP